MEETRVALSKNFVKELSKQSREFCIIGLTGKVRSGTSDVCSLLTNPNFPKLMDLPAIYQEGSREDTRECRIILRYLRENWKPFVELSVTSVIISYLLDLQTEGLARLTVHPDAAQPVGASILALLRNWANWREGEKTFQECVREKVLSVGDTLSYDLAPEMRDERKAALEKACGDFFSALAAQNEQAFFQEWANKVKPHLDEFDTLNQNNKEEFFRFFVFCFGVLPVLETILKKGLGREEFPLAFQTFGNNIRATGTAGGIAGRPAQGIDAKNLFVLPARVNSFIKLLRKYPLESPPERRSPVYVVINNFKNIFEAYYFKRRYSAFYLLAVSCDESMRREEFRTREMYYLTNLREDLSSGKKIFKEVQGCKRDREKIQEKFNKNLDEARAKLQFALQISQGDNNLRYLSYAQNLAPFILQDVVTCIENADIFVTRDYQEPLCQYDQQLIRLLGRIATLILHPGLLTPTRIERCMQIAMTAKLNSGCLSRQVGAVVTDQSYSVLSLGWNDVPCGAESCLRRNFFDLAGKSDKLAYSDFERENEEFRAYVDAVNRELGQRMGELGGLPMAFCFKDIYQDMIKQRDQIYTRALHGEERALAACDNQRAKGGYLFTTSSPCELCAKRAKEMGISKIYYIEQYPGISRTHVNCIGPKATQAQYEFFVGAVGLAYIKLYTPLIPYKDELAALDFSPSITYGRLEESGKKPPAAPPEPPPPPPGQPGQPEQPGQPGQPGQSN